MHALMYTKYDYNNGDYMAFDCVENIEKKCLSIPFLMHHLINSFTIFTKSIMISSSLSLEILQIFI